LKITADWYVRDDGGILPIVKEATVKYTTETDYLMTN
jgi:hypothetical protein